MTHCEKTIVYIVTLIAQRPGPSSMTMANSLSHEQGALIKNADKGIKRQDKENSSCPANGIIRERGFVCYSAD